MQTASILVKPASGLCNTHCDYCFYCDEAAHRAAAQRGMMEVETLRTLIRKTLPATRLQYSLAFQGGEPTLRGLDFFCAAAEMAWRYNRNNARVTLSLQTNGAALDDVWAEFLAENGFLVGLSVDGTAALHDRHRHLNDGGSAYAAALRAAELLDRHRVPYNILTVAHRETAAHIREIYAAYRQRGWRWLQFIDCLDPLDAPAVWSLTPADYGDFLVTLFDLWQADALRGAAPSIRLFDNWLGILLGRPPEACAQSGVCGIQYVVEADGDVYPCDFYALDAWRLGNIRADTLAQIDEKRSALGFCARSIPLPAQCAACPWLRLCRNGCYRQRDAETGLSKYCASYRLFFEQRGDRLAALAQRISRGKPLA